MKRRNHFQETRLYWEERNPNCRGKQICSDNEEERPCHGSESFSTSEFSSQNPFLKNIIKISMRKSYNMQASLNIIIYIVSCRGIKQEQ